MRSNRTFLHYNDLQQEVDRDYHLITFNAATAGAVNTSSFSHTTGAISDGLIVVFVALRVVGDSVSGVTYGGQALARANNALGTESESDIWYKVAPLTGANTVAISGTLTDDYRVYAATFAGVTQTTPLDDFDDGSGNSAAATATTTPTENNELIVGMVTSEGGSAPSTGAGETTLFNHDNGTWASAASYVIQTTAAAQAINYTVDDDTWVVATASFKQAVGGATLRRYSLPLTGLG